MVGLGAGARSYTTRLHYSHDYAVELRHVRGVLAAYLDADDLGVARFGFRLDGDEQRRRWLLRTLLVVDGVDLPSYAARFGGARPEDDFPELAELLERGWAQSSPDRFRLTAEGLARADAIGPWLVSPQARAAMESAALHPRPPTLAAPERTPRTTARPAPATGPRMAPSTRCRCPRPCGSRHRVRRCHHRRPRA
jgi:oxygen-independent coproporphyrinogen-3 oxidase